MQDQPFELIVHQALNLNLGDIGRLCRVNRQFKALICDNEDFWRQRYYQDYGYHPPLNGGSWKELYRSRGQVWAWGHTNGYNLGLGQGWHKHLKYPDRSAGVIGPTLVTNIPTQAVSLDIGRILLLDGHNNVHAAGYNEDGALGLGPKFSDRNLYNFVQIPNLKAKQICANDGPAAFIDLDNNLLLVGKTRYPEPTGYKAKKMAIDWRRLLFIQPDGQVVWIDYNQPPIFIPEIRGVDVAIVERTMVVLDDEGTVWTWGKNDYGQLGHGDMVSRDQPTPIPNIKGREISVSKHVLMIDLEGRVWGWGKNGHGELGLGYKGNVFRPRLIPNIRAKKISCGVEYSLLIDLEGRVWGCGSDYDGRLGLGRSTTSWTILPNRIATEIYASYYNSVMIGNVLN